MGELGRHVDDVLLAHLRGQVEAEYGRPSALYEAFVRFHRANPEIAGIVARYAEQVRQAGVGSRRRRRYGIGAIWERVRWHLVIETRDETGLKLNNNHRAYYARYLALRYPGTLGSLFATRRLGQDHHIVGPRVRAWR